MLQTEYLRNLNVNYERIRLEKRPEENRYQYCILNRGGIRGLLPCSLRYMNGEAYLYYDISSKQNAAQRFGSRCIGREWVRDLLWSMEQTRQELGRFLLDMRNVLWYPEQIFQDLENNTFFFLYFPYYEGECSFTGLLEFLVDHVDYNDEALVDCVYCMYERMESVGEAYLQSQIFEDAKVLESPAAQDDGKAEEGDTAAPAAEMPAEEEGGALAQRREEKKSIFGFLDSRRRRNREIRNAYSEDMHRAMGGYAVAEETRYHEEEFGRTVYIEEKPEEAERVRSLYTSDDRLAAALEKPVVSIGKKKAEADVVLEDASVSRLHARITREGKEYFLEDLNSTNGTFKNGLRLQPYEKRKLETGDELKCGRVVLVFR